MIRNREQFVGWKWWYIRTRKTTVGWIRYCRIDVLYQQYLVYYLLNKPVGFISSRSDNFDRPVVTDLIPEHIKVYPVGRLDYATSGLILVTNDGELANGLMHPKFKVPKTYLAKIKGDYTKADLEELARGVVIDGVRTRPAKVRSINYNPKNSSSYGDPFSIIKKNTVFELNEKSINSFKDAFPFSA